MQTYFIHARCDEATPADHIFHVIEAENVIEAFKCLARLIVTGFYSEHGDFDIDVDFFLESNFAHPEETPVARQPGVYIWLPNHDDVWQQTIIHLGSVKAAK